MLRKLETAQRFLAAIWARTYWRAKLRLEVAKRPRKPVVERRDGVRYGFFVVPKVTPEWEQIICSMSHVLIGHGYLPQVITNFGAPCLPLESLRQMAFLEEEVNAASLMIIDSSLMNEESRRLKAWAIDMGMSVATLYHQSTNTADPDYQQEFRTQTKAARLSSRAGRPFQIETLHRVEYADTGDAIRRLNHVLLSVLKSTHLRHACSRTGVA